MTAIEGLSKSEVLQRRALGKGNNVELRPSRSYWQILAENLFTFFNVTLFGLGIFLVVMGRPIDAFFTTGIALINVLIAVTQEVGAKRKLDRIALLARPEVSVVRQGITEQIDPSDVVLGDVLLASPGDQIVVDGELIGNSHLDVDESLLTGESEPVTKQAGDDVFSGSYCVSGQGMYRAKKVGFDSFANQLAVQARSFGRDYTPLQKEINLVVRILLVVILYLAILLTLNAVFHDRPLVENASNTSVLFGIAPSSLFLMIVVAYAVGAVRMADKGALVQSISSVESLCHVTLVCLDKTGTLTSNALRLEQIMPVDSEQRTIDELRQLLGNYACSASGGNRTNDALKSALGGQPQPVVEEVPFSSARKWSALTFEGRPEAFSYFLGAPEMLLPHLKSGPDAEIEAMLDDWTASGYRVLLFAESNEAEPLFSDTAQPRLPSHLRPLALISLSDELRPEARRILDGFAIAGIEQKIISGDNPKTVMALARQAGFDQDGRNFTALSGPEMVGMSESELELAAQQATIFGRVTPQQKEKLVKLFQDQGHYVAMTGDGVNDVLALKQANLGIAMQSGSQATRSVADIVLLNDSFAALPPTIIEGQRILHSMQDILKLYFTRILNLYLLVTAVAILGIGFPFTPAENALISSLTLSLPAIMLALWARPGPLPVGGLTPRLMHFVIPATLTMTVAGMAVYLFFLFNPMLRGQMANVPYAQQALTYVVTACGIMLIIFVEPPTEYWVGGDRLSGDWRPTLLAFVIFLLMALAVIIKPIRDFYGLIPMRPRDYLIISGVVIIWTFVVRHIWRARLVERYLNVDFEGST